MVVLMIKLRLLKDYGERYPKILPEILLEITKGLWGEISENFARNTTGDVICHIGGKREKC